MKRHSSQVKDNVKERMDAMRSNPVLDAISLQHDRQPGGQSSLGLVKILEDDMRVLERFQPRDPNINVRNASSFDFFIKTIYKPQENIDHV